MSILVTGGTGYIGSHTVVELLNVGEKVIIVDNLINSQIETIDKIKEITGKDVKFYQVDLLDRENLDRVFEENPDIESVIHFAGLKAVGESVQKPLEYYKNNLIGTITLLEIMRKYNCKKIIFSSSATVYGEQVTVKYVETMKRGETSSTYGTTKAIIEKMLEDIYFADNSWNISILRYFNPIGAHESGLIGEDPKGIPNNLMPFIMKVANKEIDHLNIFGNDYDTKDGTAARDYIHVVDLAKGHLKALEKLNNEKNGLYVYNLGTGNPYTVQEIVDTFQKVNDIEVPYEYTERRAGDLPIFYADPTKAKNELGWEAEKGIEDMCKDSWNFVKVTKQN